MNVTYACHECDLTTRSDLDEQSTAVSCMHCGHEVAIPPDALTDGEIHRCVVCPSKELFVRKNFPQQLGVAIVAVGLVASCVPWYFHQWYTTFAILFTTALIDVILYATMGDLLQCYRCHSQYRDIAGLDDHQPFDLEVHERHRQQLARLNEASSK